MRGEYCCSCGWSHPYSSTGPSHNVIRKHTHGQCRIGSFGGYGPSSAGLRPRNRKWNTSLADQYTRAQRSLSQVKIHHLMDDEVSHVPADSFSAASTSISFDRMTDILLWRNSEVRQKLGQTKISGLLFPSQHFLFECLCKALESSQSIEISQASGSNLKRRP